MNPENQSCESFEMLASAMLDGELIADQQRELDSHLEHCDCCKKLVADFQRVDGAVGALGLRPGESKLGGGEDVDCPLTNSVTETFVVTRQKQSAKNWLSPWRLVPLAGVAALLVGLFIVVSQSPPEATADQFSPDEFVEPLAGLNRINLQQHRDQELMLRTLGMDLRALKLELREMESTTLEDRQRLEKQIETMLERVGSFERE